MPIHLIRHHQQTSTKQKKSSGDIKINEIGNGTEEMDQIIPITENPEFSDLIVKPHEEITLHCYISQGVFPPRLPIGK